jgi:hypothetical protein
MSWANGSIDSNKAFCFDFVIVCPKVAADILSNPIDRISKSSTIKPAKTNSSLSIQGKNTS